MRKIYLILFLLFIPLINCHISVVAKLIKNEKYKLKGTFTINSANISNRYLSIKDRRIIFSKKKHKFDIIEVSKDTYFIVSKFHKKFIGVNKYKPDRVALYGSSKKKNQYFTTWEIVPHESNLTKSHVIYTIKNKFGNKYLSIDNKGHPMLLFIPRNEFPENIKFRFLKLYQEEENIKQTNIDKVEQEPIDLFMKYIDLNDKDLKREGINQIYKDYDAEELRYSLRSIFQYIPWIRKVFIVMPNEKVKFLKPYDEIKDRIVYIKDKEFLGYDSANIFAFTFNLHKMEKFGISKNFIYMEDDYFLGKPLNKTDFFYYDEKEQKVLPFVITTKFNELNIKMRLALHHFLSKTKEKIKIHGHRGWLFTVLNTDKFFIEKYGNKTTNIINAEFTHNARAENIDDLKEIYKEIQDYKYINETLFSPTRSIMSLNQPHFDNLYQLNIKKRKVNPIPNLYINMEDSKFIMTKFPLFVLNTCGDNVPTKEDYEHLTRLMKKRFPNATIYEIEEKENKDKLIANKPEIKKEETKITQIINKREKAEKAEIIEINKDTKYINSKNEITDKKKDTLENSINDKNDVEKNNINSNDNNIETIQISNNTNNTNQNVNQNNIKNKDKELSKEDNDNKSSKNDSNDDNNGNDKHNSFNDNLFPIKYNSKYYSVHGYILLGILFGLIIFVKIKNTFEYEY